MSRSFWYGSAWFAGMLLAGVVFSIPLNRGFIIGLPDQHAAPGNQVPVRTVIISEVAWAGTASSTGDEWIELYNPGTTSIDLTGWQLVTDDLRLSVTITGCTPSCVLSGGNYFLLERNENATDVPANLDYGAFSGDLSNVGTVLRLQAPNGPGLFTDVDTANLGNGSGGWYAGSEITYASMERVDVIPDAAGAWISNNDIIKNGLDRNGLPLRATPGQQNSGWIQPPTDTPTPTSSATPTETSSPTASSTPGNTPTYTPSAPMHLVIGEFRSRGPNGDGDEFIEIFNASGAAINIGGALVKKSSGCGASISTLYTFPTNTILLPGQHYLLTSGASSSISGADGTFSPGISDDGGVAIFLSSSAIYPVDSAGMCISTYYLEGVPLPPLSGLANQSYERKPGGASGGCYDLNNNMTDFLLLSSSSPQNSVSPLSICSGVLTSTVTQTPSPTSTNTPTRTRTPTPTRTPTSTRTPSRTPTPLPGQPVINEFLPHPRTDWNMDGTTDFGDEYIEIINVGVQTANLKGWKLQDGSGLGAYALPEILLQPRQIIVFFGKDTGISLSDGGDGVRLIQPDGKIANAYDYPLVAAVDQAWCRLPDGLGPWSFSCWPTPGKPNTRNRAGAPIPAPGIMDCTLADTAPLSIRAAECGSSGDSIWNPKLWLQGELWLTDHGKWDLFFK